jgi:plastocyanin
MIPHVLASLERALAYLGRLSAQKLVVGFCLLTAIETSALVAFAAQTQRIVQHGRAFNAATVTIAAGDTLEFNNEDDFIHQIYVQSPSFNFDSEEQPPGQLITLRFLVKGSFEVRCHIHPKMLLKVDVD